MHPLLVPSHADTALTPFNAFAPGQGALARPVWGPAQLLRDLELRLGLGGTADAASDVSRILCWKARMRAIAPATRFYSASFDVDPLGTACSVLALRDALEACGWSGEPLPNGGARLDALVELESLTEPQLLPTVAGRALAIAAALSQTSKPTYATLTLTEPEASWPGCLRRVFDALRRTGTEVLLLAPLEPQAAPTTDLGKIQRALSEGSSPGSVQLVGDGSFLRVTAETASEAAHATAALLATPTDASSVVIREREAAVLDHALRQHGLPSQGLDSSSSWRAVLQVLPLALELAFEPKDPQRILELLNLSQGPFEGVVCRYLTRALQRSPGVGGRAWLDAKAKLATLLTEPTSDDGARREQLTQQLALIETWLETRGSDAIGGAPKDALLAIVSQVRAWLLEQVNRRSNDTLVHVGVQQCDALLEALALEQRVDIDLVHVRRLVEFVTHNGAA